MSEHLIHAALTDAPVKALFTASTFWGILFVIMAIAGVYVQIRSTTAYEIEAYENRI